MRLKMRVAHTPALSPFHPFDPESRPFQRIRGGKYPKQQQAILGTKFIIFLKEKKKTNSKNENNKL